MREVDIVIEIPAGPRTVTVGVEVSDRRRPADTPWVEAIAAKHKRLPVDRTVLVSRSGFRRPALVTATALKLEHMTFVEALGSDHWSKLITGLPSVRVIHQFTAVRKVIVNVARAEDLATVSTWTLPQTELVPIRGEPIGLPKFVDSVVESREYQSAHNKFGKTGGTFSLSVHFRPARLLRRSAHSDACIEIAGLEIRVDHQVIDEHAHLAKAEYGSAAVTVAQSEIQGKPIKMLLSQEREKPIEVRIKVPKGVQWPTAKTGSSESKET
ncbi:MAG: hypothetical protein IT450_23325 [Phycisphaerales bacterium]|nr:hypothetical protein [Phycisphaerales bacterium]